MIRRRAAALLLLVLASPAPAQQSVIWSMPSAYSIPYDDSVAPALNATTVQDAIDALKTSVASGVTNYHLVSSTSFSTSSATDVQITGFTLTPTSGTYEVIFSANASNTGAGSDNTCTIYNGAGAITDSARTEVGPSGSHKFLLASSTTAQWNGTNVATVYCNTGGSLTITGRSLTLIRLGP